MHERRQARDAAMLRQLRSLQKAADQQELANAQARVEERSREVEDADRRVNDTHGFWLACMEGRSALDPAQLGLAATTLAQDEERLAAAIESHKRAHEVADTWRQRFAESTVRLTQAEDVARTLSRCLAHRLQEQRQFEIEERTAFEWSSHV
jgi:hypothetical protein